MADLAARHAAHAAESEARVLEVLRSGRWVGGPVVAEAESMAADLFDRPAAVGVASGTDALVLALQALGVHAGQRVAVPALTFFATAGAVAALGADLVIVDVDERGLLCERSLAHAGPVDAVIPVHLFGNAAFVPDHPLVVDDAAQAAGSPTPAGRLTAVSTYPTKTWSGLGDGGFVLGRAEDLAGVRLLGNHGAVGPHVHVAHAGHVGRNSRLDPVSAAVLLAQRPGFADRRARRRRIASHYDACLARSGARPLPRDPESATPTYVLRVSDRDAVQERLASVGIGTAVYYPHPLHHQRALHGRIAHAHAPNAERLCNALLAVPVHAGLDDAEVDRVGAALEGL
jgi:dTDP-4-amino-4,6-dideoxygalactose transaminase